MILENNQLTLQEIFERLCKEKVQIKYRESVFRALDKLVDAGLIEKFYNRNKGICYKLSVRKIEIDLVSGSVTARSGESIESKGSI